MSCDTLASQLDLANRRLEHSERLRTAIVKQFHQDREVSKKERRKLQVQATELILLQLDLLSELLDLLEGEALQDEASSVPDQTRRQYYPHAGEVA